MSENQTTVPLYTGPLSVSAAVGRAGQPRDTGEHTIILTGLAYDCGREPDSPIRVRMEMTPEEADDLAASLIFMAKAARE